MHAVVEFADTWDAKYADARVIAFSLIESLYLIDFYACTTIYLTQNGTFSVGRLNSVAVIPFEDILFLNLSCIRIRSFLAHFWLLIPSYLF